MIFPVDVWGVILGKCSFKTFQTVSCCCKRLRRMFCDYQARQFEIYGIPTPFLSTPITAIDLHRLYVLCSKLPCKTYATVYRCNIRQIYEFDALSVSTMARISVSEVELVMSQVDCTMAQAVISLWKYDNDIVHAIMSLV